MGVVAVFGFDAFSDECGDDMGGFEVEVVVWAVEVYGEDEDGFHSILQFVGVEHLPGGFFGDAVGGVGGFGVAVPEVFFFEGDGGEVWVGADGSGLDELSVAFYEAVGSCLFDEVHGHGHVCVEVSAWVFHVGADASDFGGEVDDHGGFVWAEGVVVEGGAGVFFGEVVLG